ncbi:hypothetical protein BDR26DRAFT_412567 [Obelidium mucronatum]|nr:hypothetical protein BDR26DRAFT_412567 [Obelidium mucronatum]
MQHSVSDINVEDIVNHMNNKIPNTQIKDYPYDIEEALLLWFRKCVDHAIKLTRDPKIIQWKRQTMETSELTSFLHDGVAPCLVAFSYINGFKINDVSFEGDIGSNWKLLETRGAADGIPIACWKPDEIIRHGCLTSFEVPFLVFACDLFEWIELSNKLPIDEIVQNVVEAKGNTESARPGSHVPWLDQQETYKGAALLEDSPSETTKALPREYTANPEVQGKWLPIDDHLFGVQKVHQPPPPPSEQIPSESPPPLSSISSLSNLDLSLSMDESKPLETETVSVPPQSDTPAARASTSESAALKDQNEVIFQSFMKQFDDAVDSHSVDFVEQQSLVRMESVESTISSQDMYSTMEPVALAPNHSGSHKETKPAVAASRDSHSPVTTSKPVDLEAFRQPSVSNLGEPKPPQPQMAPQAAKPKPPANPPSTTKAASPKKTNSVKKESPSTNGKPKTIPLTDQTRTTTAPTNDQIAVAAETPRLKSSTTTTTTTTVTTNSQSITSTSSLNVTSPAKDRKRKLRNLGGGCESHPETTATTATPPTPLKSAETIGTTTTTTTTSFETPVVVLPKILSPPPHHTAAPLPPPPPSLDSSGGGTAGQSESTITTTTTIIKSGRTTPELLKLPPIPTTTQTVRIVSTTSITVHEQDTAGTVVVKEETEILPVQEPATESLIGHHNHQVLSELDEEAYDSTGDDNRPPSFNLSDMIMSDSEPTDDEEELGTRQKNRRQQKQQQASNGKRGGSTASTAIAKPLKSSLKKTTLNYQQHLLQQQAAAILAATGSSVGVTDGDSVEAQDEDDEWVELYRQPRNSSSKYSNSVNGSGKRRKHSRKLIRVPADIILSKSKKLEPTITEFESDSVVVPKNEEVEEGKQQESAGILKSTALESNIEFANATKDLPKFKGLVFVPFGDDAMHMSDNDSDGDKLSLDPPPRSNLPRRLSARFASLSSTTKYVKIMFLAMHGFLK